MSRECSLLKRNRNELFWKIKNLFIICLFDPVLEKKNDHMLRGGVEFPSCWICPGLSNLHNKLNMLEMPVFRHWDHLGLGKQVASIPWVFDYLLWEKLATVLEVRPPRDHHAVRKLNLAAQEGRMERELPELHKTSNWLFLPSQPRWQMCVNEETIWKRILQLQPPQQMPCGLGTNCLAEPFPNS